MIYSTKDKKKYNNEWENELAMIMSKMADMIIFDIEQRGLSYSSFADLCGISRNELLYILNRRKNDIRLSTIVRICKNSNVQIEKIFCKCDVWKIINNSTLGIGDGQYRLKLEEMSLK